MGSSCRRVKGGGAPTVNCFSFPRDWCQPCHACRDAGGIPSRTVHTGKGTTTARFLFSIPHTERLLYFIKQKQTDEQIGICKMHFPAGWHFPIDCLRGVRYCYSPQIAVIIFVTSLLNTRNPLSLSPLEDRMRLLSWLTSPKQVPSWLEKRDSFLAIGDSEGHRRNHHFCFRMIYFTPRH